MERLWIDRFCSHLSPKARILDIGCGHGQPIAAHLLSEGFDVWGIDRAPSFIETARHNLPDGTWHVADMASFELDEDFHGIVMWHSLFHLTGAEQRKVFPRMGAHAQPGTLLLMTTGPAAGSTNGEFGGDVLAHHSLDPAEYEELLAAHNFVVLDHRISDPECGGATVWLAVVPHDE